MWSTQGLYSCIPGTSGPGTWSTVWLWSSCQESEKPNEVPLGLPLLFGFCVESVTFVASAFIVLILVCCLLFGLYLALSFYAELKSQQC